MNIDLLLQKSLETLAACDGYISSTASLDNIIPFGCIAFIKENDWENNLLNYIPPKTKRVSHPGLSLSDDTESLAFGSSQLDNRNPMDKNIFFINQEDCEILTKNMVFLLNLRIPGNITMIDHSKTGYKKICEKKLIELEKRLNDK